MYITQGLKRAVQTNSNGIATIDGQRQQTWSEFAKRVAKLAGAFKKLKLSEEGRVAILSFNSDRHLESIHAIITFKENCTATEEEISQHCRKLIAGYKCPRSFEIRQKPMPMSGAGKILKKELRAPFWQEKI